MKTSVQETSVNGANLPALLLRGLDSLYVSFYLDTTSATFDWDDLDLLKERVCQSRTKTFSKITLGTETFALLPRGHFPYRYVLENRSFQVRLGKHIRPSCHVQFFSEALWKEGLDSLARRFMRWCRSVKLLPTAPETIARADWAFDYDLAEIDFLPEHFVSNAAKKATWQEHDAVQTIQIGAGVTVIRIYDKVAEIAQQSGKAWFFELWGCEEGVWRVEIQVRGERLKQASIATLEDLKLLQNDLLRELATKHTTLRKPSSDSNRSRWPLHRLWKALLRDIASLPQTGLICHIDPKLPLDWRLHQQGKSLYGIIKGIGALLTLKAANDNEPISFAALLERLPEVLEHHHVAWDWDKQIKHRVTGYKLGKW